MTAVSLAEMLAAESAAISRGLSEEQLLDEVGLRLGLAIGRHFPQRGTAIAYLGKGHNAGDSIVALRILRDRFGWRVAVRHAFEPEQWAPLVLMKHQELAPVEASLDLPDWREMAHPLLLIDGLLGCGGKGPPRGTNLELALEMEWLRQNAGARVAAVDLPSGMDPDTGECLPGTVTADITFMIANAKKGLLRGSATSHTGALAIVPVDSLATKGTSELALICPQIMDFGKSPRAFDFHKGMAGRVSIVAGSMNYSGAAVLAATGALRGGGGLVTLHVPLESLELTASRCPPEIILTGYQSLVELKNVVCDAWVIGCGLGALSCVEIDHLVSLLSTHQAPAVVDAGALNSIASAARLDCLKERHVITPHPGEFRRLAPDLADRNREDAARAFAETCPATLLLKGSRTIVTRKGFSIWCNATGTPAMAGGGQGDLLSGVIGACLAGGRSGMEAAALSAWVCGRAAEITIAEGITSEESLTPSDVALHLGKAFNEWRFSSR